MTSKNVFQKLLDSDQHKVKLAVTDLDGVLLGKIVSMEKFRSVVDAGFGFCNVIFGWDMHDLCYDASAGIRYTGWHTGFPDAQAVVDPSTYRKFRGNRTCLFFWLIFVPRMELLWLYVRVMF